MLFIETGESQVMLKKVNLSSKACKMSLVEFDESKAVALVYEGGSSWINHKALTSARTPGSKYKYFATQKGRLAKWVFKACLFLAEACRMALILASWPLIFVLRKNYSVG
jgi:hypothetical protein